MVAIDYDEILTLLKPLSIYIVGIAIYAVFIFKFYKFLAKRDIFSLNLHEYSESFIGAVKNFFKTIFYIIEYLIIFPLFAYFWFLILSFLLLLLSKNSDIGSVLMTSMALVSAVRVTAYYNEDLSKDLAKMVPFALLGVFIVDANYFSTTAFMDSIALAPSFLFQSVYYLCFLVLLELILRIISFFFHLIKGD